MRRFHGASAGVIKPASTLRCQQSPPRGNSYRQPVGQKYLPIVGSARSKRAVGAPGLEHPSVETGSVRPRICTANVQSWQWPFRMYTAAARTLRSHCQARNRIGAFTFSRGGPGFLRLAAERERCRPAASGPGIGVHENGRRRAPSGMRTEDLETRATAATRPATRSRRSVENASYATHSYISKVVEDGNY